MLSVLGENLVENTQETRVFGEGARGGRYFRGGANGEVWVGRCGGQVGEKKRGCWGEGVGKNFLQGDWLANWGVRRVEEGRGFDGLLCAVSWAVVDILCLGLRIMC